MYLQFKNGTLLTASNIPRLGFLLPPIHSDIAWPYITSPYPERWYVCMINQCLKKALVEAPVLSYPRFDVNAPIFVLQTDASSVGLEAVLKQNGNVIAYASTALNRAE